MVNARRSVSVPFVLRFLLLTVLLQPALARAGVVNVEAKGEMRCGGVPMPYVQVDLMYSKVSWTDSFDSVMASGVTDENGRWQLRGSGGSIWGPPPPYARVVYRSPFGDPPVPPTKGTRVINEIRSIRSDHHGTRDFPWVPAVIDMGVLNFDTIDCRLWMNARIAGSDYIYAIDSAAPLPYNELDMLRWSGIYHGTPWAARETIHWPTNYSVAAKTVFHEFGHTVRHSYDGDFNHFVWDSTRFLYARNHVPSDVTNEGFAFNEGWAYLWGTRASTPPAPLSHVNSPPNWAVEGDVAADLRRIADCPGISMHNMVIVLRENPGSIHSRDEFWAALRRKFPRACDPPPPPDPTMGCASGTVTQHFFDGMSGCAGTVTRDRAASLCAPGFAPCTANQWLRSRRHLKPEHHYWLGEKLDRDNVLRGCAARPAGRAIDCGDARSMHVCRAGAAVDPEGNQCGFRDCDWDPWLGKEFLDNLYFGGCTASDTTAGTLCCPIQKVAAAIPEMTPQEQKPREKVEDRAVLLQAIAELQGQLAAARAEAALPKTCPQDTGCGPLLSAIVAPALIEGTIEQYQLDLDRLDAAPSSMQELQQRLADGGREQARRYVQQVVDIRIRALNRAIAALEKALAQPSTREAALEAVNDLKAQIAALEAVRQNPDNPPPDIHPFDAEKWPARRAR
jgi:Transthyretin-like family